jgi:hypothetical protein
VDIQGDTEGNFEGFALPAGPIAPGGTYRMPVRFAPKSAGEKLATVTFVSNAVNNPEVLLYGIGFTKGR